MKWFFNLRIRVRLNLSFMLIAIVSAITGVLGIVFVFSVKDGGAYSAAGYCVVLGILAFVNIVIALGLANYNAGLILRPIRKNHRQMERVAVGNLYLNDIITEEDAASLQCKDEIGAFTREFVKLLDYILALIKSVETIAGGDLTEVVPLASEKDELGRALTGLVKNFNSLAGAIAAATDKIADGSILVSDSSLELSQGATEQASAVQELNASLEQVYNQTNLNAENAEKANELAENAKRNAAAGNEQMQAMLKAMEEISSASGNIGKIIKVIDDIAFQTNILALNAAVEAARAGQHGKGFAVVAEEVRNLAGQAANAAKETTDLIESSIRKVEAGTVIANQTARALDDIVLNVDKAAALIGSIALASAEQAREIELINTGIGQVSKVIQTNAATAEENAAASEELSSQAAQLKEQVGQFQLGEGDRQEHKAERAPVLMLR